MKPNLVLTCNIPSANVLSATCRISSKTGAIWLQNLEPLSLNGIVSAKRASLAVIWTVCTEGVLSAVRVGEVSENGDDGELQ